MNYNFIMPELRVLTIDLTRRLPDISKADRIPEDLEDYGRCAVLNTGHYWFASVNSSHPANTKEGFYWGLDKDVLYLSPRGSALDWEKYIIERGDFISFLTKKIGINRRYDKYGFIRE